MSVSTASASSASQVLSAASSFIVGKALSADAFAGSLAASIISRVASLPLVGGLLDRIASVHDGNSGRGGILHAAVKYALLLPPVVSTVGWTLCRFRLLPHRTLYQAWFGGVLTAGFIGCGAIALPVVALNRIGLVSSENVHRFGSYVAQLMVKWIFFMNPQLRIERDYTRTQYEEVNKGAVYAVAPHLSFADGFLMFNEPPLGFFSHVKFMGKASLHDMPIVGFLIYDVLKYFKAYYQSEDYSAWSVDREKQAAEMQRVTDWIVRDGKTFAYSPEGRVGKDFEKVQNPRHGMLKILYGTRKPMYILILYPAFEFWPPGSTFGGIPCDMKVTLAKYIFKDGMTNAETGEVDAAAVANDLENFMQKELDRLRGR